MAFKQDRCGYTRQATDFSFVTLLFFAHLCLSWLHREEDGVAPEAGGHGECQ